MPPSASGCPWNSNDRTSRAAAGGGRFACFNRGFTDCGQPRATSTTAVSAAAKATTARARRHRPGFRRRATGLHVAMGAWAITRMSARARGNADIPQNFAEMKLVAIAGITPTYRILEADAEKLKSLVWSWNGPRRHLTSSQKAMAYAMMWPNGKERGGDRRSTDFNVEKNQHRSKEDIDRATISRARFILKHAPETAKLVRDGHPNCGGWRTPRDYFFVAFLNPPERRCLPRFRTAKFKIILIIMNQ